MKRADRWSARTAAGALLALGMVGPLRAEVVDRIVAVVGGSVITWSAVYEEASYQAFRKGEAPPAWTVSEPAPSDAFSVVVSQLIDQALLRQALSRSPFALAGSEEIQGRLREVEQSYPSAAAYREALARYRLSETQVSQRLARESLLFAFIDATLRPQVRLTAEQVESYYENVLVPQLRSAGGSSAESSVPPLGDVRAQIEEILSQQQISRLLEPWLEQLRRSAKIERRLE